MPLHISGASQVIGTPPIARMRRQQCCFPNTHIVDEHLDHQILLVHVLRCTAVRTSRLRQGIPHLFIPVTDTTLVPFPPRFSLTPSWS